LIPDPTDKGRLLLYRETGKTPMSLLAAQVTGVDPEPSRLDEFAARKRRPDPSAEDEFALGTWCLENRLPDLATGQYEAAIKLDPEFAPAREALGHVFHEGRWLTSEQARSAKGLVYHKGKWITPEEAAQRKVEDAMTAEQTTWRRKLGVLLRSYRAGPENRRNDVELQLMAIRDTSAIPGLLASFGAADEPAARRLAAQVLAAIPAPEGAEGLVTRILMEKDDDVREATLAELAKRDDPIVVERLLGALRSKSEVMINRSAWALGRLQAIETVPRLVDALISSERRLVFVDSNPRMAASTAGVPAAAPNGGLLFMGGRNIPILTGPAVAPGAVAFGATSTPAIDYYAGMNASMPGPNRGPVAVNRTFKRENTEVLAALQSLTGQDFGYDVAAWKRWIGRMFQPAPPPVRVVPQP
jgi:hypothetical protein